MRSRFSKPSHAFSLLDSPGQSNLAPSSGVWLWLRLRGSAEGLVAKACSSVSSLLGTGRNRRPASLPHLAIELRQLRQVVSGGSFSVQDQQLDGFTSLFVQRTPERSFVYGRRSAASSAGRRRHRPKLSNRRNIGAHIESPVRSVSRKTSSREPDDRGQWKTFPRTSGSVSAGGGWSRIRDLPDRSDRQDAGLGLRSFTPPCCIRPPSLIMPAMLYLHLIAGVPWSMTLPVPQVVNQRRGRRVPRGPESRRPLATMAGALSHRHEKGSMRLATFHRFRTCRANPFRALALFDRSTRSGLNDSISHRTGSEAADVLCSREGTTLRDPALIPAQVETGPSILS